MRNELSIVCQVFTYIGALVPHEQGKFHLPESLAMRTTYVGPIVKPLPIDPELMQIRFNLLEKKTLVISAGGGGYRDTAQYFDLCLRVFTHLKTWM
jgi:hypothetical protein